MRLVMFDMDGTLYRTETSFIPAVQGFAARHSFAMPDEAFLLGFVGQNGTTWDAWLESLQLGIALADLNAEFDALELEHIQSSGELYAGAEGIIRELASQGWRLGICSNSSTWYVQAILGKAGMLSLFDPVRVPRTRLHTKTLMLCEVWNEFHPDQCAMVGDRADDMRAARAGGFLGIGAAYGFAPGELGAADVCISDITDVITVLDARWAALPPRT
jgi:phosphoglycolate phosphatase